MGALIKVDPEQLRSTANQIRTYTQEYETAYNQLYTNVDNMANGWKGEDNLAFTDQIKGFREDFEKMKQLMEQYASFLDISANNYDSTQDGVASTARQLTN